VNAILPNAYAQPDAEGRFGPYGGRFVPETLMPLVLQLDEAYAAAKADPTFQAELDGFLTHYVGRESPLYFAERLTEHFGGANIWLKREDLNHTGAHKINNCMGQILLARFQSVIGKEIKTQAMAQMGKLPEAVVACIGGGSNAIGAFHPFIDDAGVRLIGVEAAGHGLDTPDHAASLKGGRPGVLHGNRTYLLQDDDGQILEGHSISAGLDYPGIGPEHAWLHDIGRAEYRSATDQEALDAFQLCSKLEGIIPALEPSHALARTGEIAKEVGKGGDLVLLMSGRGDKDIFQVAKYLGVEL
jgi:tryptophan synthase beta subunit